MITARVLSLDHAGDRREVAARFGLIADDLDGTVIQVGGVDPQAAARLAAVLAADGAAAGVARDGDRADLLVAGRAPALLAALRARDPALAECCAEAVRRAHEPPPPLVARGRRLSLDGRPLVVGILNATPDSFYDRGRHFGVDRSLARAEAMLEEGADVIEVGGETARPSEPVVPVAEEVARVRPVIEAIAARWPVPIGIDTYKPEVARAALEAGASIVNDISGLADDRVAEVAAAAGAALVVMHIQGRPKVANPHARYERVVDEVYAFLAARTARAEALGVARQSLLVDPGFSFGKRPAHDLALVRRLREFRGLGYPIYLAASRKNFIRDLMGLPFDELLEGTLAVVAVGVRAGARLVRTHDVRATRRLVAMLEAIQTGEGRS
ncbi:MAG: dihydropteroate synthase [Armatimonadota bacterium]|nr:dihydropteroate synthase [Armatimonadota bacterium]